ncbi:CsgG/HfaB family protein [Treponema sp. R80B11-R83G3]
MKKRFFTVVLLFAALSVFGQANKPVPLDTALMVAAERIDGRLSEGIKIALLNFNSPTDKFSAYVLDELTAYLVDSGVLEVIDRKEIDLRRNELNFQMSGDVSDASMQSIGRTLGAQSIVSGSLTEIDAGYRIVVRVLNVESGKVEVQYRTNIIKDNLVMSLLNIARPPKTAGEKTGTGALNILLGLGSYLEGDIGGGITVTAGYTVAAGLFVVEATMLDWDNPMVGVPATAGVAVAGLTLVYGFVRPFIYSRAPRVADVMDNARFKIVQTPVSDNGALAFQLAYSVKF